MNVNDLHLGFPRDYIALSRGFSSSHKGIDMCWNSAYGGQNAPVYAPQDGTVVSVVDGKGNTWSKGKGDWGNLVKIQHADGVYTLSAHLLKGSILVKKGDPVSRGQMIAKMNNSGYSNGSHVHFEVYVGGSSISHRVDPLKYCYAYPEDTVNASTQKEYNILHYTPPSPVPYIGTPVERDTRFNQFEVSIGNLRARKSAGLNGDVLGYVNEGIYNIINTADVDGYTWYCTEEWFWCAKVKGVTFYPAEKELRYKVTYPQVTKKDKDYLVQVAEDLGVECVIEELYV